LESRYLNIVIQ